LLPEFFLSLDMKKHLAYFFLFGMAYALIMTAIDTLYLQKPFKIWKFLMDFVLFGFFVGFGSVFFNQRQANKNTEKLNKKQDEEL